MAQLGRALPWGGRGREFESRHSDQNARCASEKEKSGELKMRFYSLLLIFYFIIVNKRSI